MEYLIPHHWFSDANSILLVMYAIGGLYFLQMGAEWLVEGASAIAFRLGMPEVVVGATIVSLGTTTPECAVSVLAAFNGNAGLALGNAVGSVIADTALIFGLGCLMVRLPADKYILSRQGWVQFGSAVLLAGVCYYQFATQGSEARIERYYGAILLALLAAYMVISVRWSRRHPNETTARVSENIAEHAEPGEKVHVADEHVTTKGPLALWGMMLAGLVVVIFSGHISIESASELAVRIGIPQVVIAATLVALGTSLPELVVGFTAIRRGHPELLVGNVIGADILNILFVTGAAASAAALPIIDSAAKVPEIFLYLHLPAMLLILTYFRICIFKATRAGHFDRWMGGPLVLMYVVYVVSQFVVSM
ncbi:sodium:calcium antiporter [uncultured Rubinisphaera sp.]|uniref:sodium:calcium antiporter n=1 Tax=uncultured Rubinisphaera sp. TaxID=1678686 RepID=UPI0030DC7CA9